MQFTDMRQIILKYPSELSCQVFSWAKFGVLTLLLNACSSGISLSFTPPAATESAFDYYQKIRTFSAEELLVERNFVQTELADTPGGSSTVKLALLLSSENPADFANEAFAVELLEQLLSSAELDRLSNDYQVFAAQWLELLKQRQEAREIALLHQQTLDALNQLQAAYGQLDERYLGLARVLASLEEQNTLLAQQNILMQQQIEALTVIEQQLAEREQLQVQQ